MHKAEQESDAFRAVIKHQTILMVVIRGVVRNHALAEDTFSDSMLEIVRSWSEYDPSREFRPWASEIARRVALANLRREQRHARLLDEALVERMAEVLHIESSETGFEVRKGALHHCLAKLPEPHRDLLWLRYFEDHSYAQLSTFAGRTPVALYSLFRRLHQVLARCVTHEIESL